MGEVIHAVEMGIFGKTNQLRIGNYELLITNYELTIMDYGLSIKDYGLRITAIKLLLILKIAE